MSFATTENPKAYKGTEAQLPLAKDVPIGSTYSTTDTNRRFYCGALGENQSGWFDEQTGGLVGDFLVYRAPADAVPPGNDDNDGMTPATPVLTMARALSLFKHGWSAEDQYKAQIISQPGDYTEGGFEIDLPFNSHNPIVLRCGANDPWELMPGTAVMAITALADMTIPTNPPLVYPDANPGQQQNDLQFGFEVALGPGPIGPFGDDALEPFVGQLVEVTTQAGFPDPSPFGPFITKWQRRIARTENNGTRVFLDDNIPGLQVGDTVRIVRSKCRTTFTGSTVYKSLSQMVPGQVLGGMLCFGCDYTVDVPPGAEGATALYVEGFTLECTGCRYNITRGALVVDRGGSLVCLSGELYRYLPDNLISGWNYGICGALIEGIAPGGPFPGGFLAQLVIGRQSYIQGADTFRNLGGIAFNKDARALLQQCQFVDCGSTIVDQEAAIDFTGRPTRLRQIQNPVPVAGLAIAGGGRVALFGPLEVSGHANGAGIDVAAGATLEAQVSPPPFVNFPLPAWIAGSGNIFGLGVGSAGRVLVNYHNTITGVAGEVFVGVEGTNAPFPGYTWAQIEASPTPVAATGSITAVAGANLIAGETFTLGDGTQAPTVFEFDDGGGVAPGNVAVPFAGGDTDAQVAAAIQAAINGVGAGLLVTAAAPVGAVVGLTNDNTGQQGNIPISDTVADAGFTHTGMSGGVGTSVGFVTSDDLAIVRVAS